MEKIYAERVGARWGQSFWIAANFSWPFAKIILTKDYGMLIILGMKKFCLQRQDIQEFKIIKAMFSTGIQIKHTRIDYPEFILFWPSDLDDMKAKLEAFQYPIKE